MADEQLPMIRVHGFKSTFERLPVKGDPYAGDKVDLKGYKLDEIGNRIKELTEEHWVTYSPSHSPINTQNVERVRLMFPDPERVGEDPDGVKLRFMQARWSQIEPAYLAFKEGREIPVHGTPLGAWPGIMQEQGDILRQNGIRTVEEVRDMTDSQLERVRLPNMRDLRKQTKLFLDNNDAAQAAQREVEKDAVIAEMAERMAAMEALLEDATAPKRGRKPKAETEDDKDAA